LLRKHLATYRAFIEADPDAYARDVGERTERMAYYQGWTRERMQAMTPEALYDYLQRLWAMLIWGNKHYVVDKLIERHGIRMVREELAELVWGEAELAERWDRFRKAIKGMGPAMMSEVLCYTHPDECMLWNRRAYVGLEFLGVANLPRYNYQLTGERYESLCATGREIAEEMVAFGLQDVTLLSVDYLIWHELQVRDTLASLHRAGIVDAAVPNEIDDRDIPQLAEFIHNEVRDKLEEIGKWLGFAGQTEVKVADGSKVDTIWEATIGNMGRVIYVFEVQTKGSIDSLILNLLKSMNNPAVQGVVAVSDATQIERIRKHAAGVPSLNEKLKTWDYLDVLQVHEQLAAVNESINRLGLVPEGF
jgi:hypothetical protein